jgi:hypothetical protein
MAPSIANKCFQFHPEDGDSTVGHCSQNHDIARKTWKGSPSWSKELKLRTCTSTFRIENYIFYFQDGDSWFPKKFVNYYQTTRC